MWPLIVTSPLFVYAGEEAKVCVRFPFWEPHPNHTVLAAKKFQLSGVNVPNGDRSLPPFKFPTGEGSGCSMGLSSPYVCVQSFEMCAFVGGSAYAQLTSTHMGQFASDWMLRGVSARMSCVQLPRGHDVSFVGSSADHSDDHSADHSDDRSADHPVGWRLCRGGGRHSEGDATQSKWVFLHSAGE